MCTQCGFSCSKKYAHVFRQLSLMDISFLKSFPTDERKEYQLPLACESFWSHTFAFVQSAFLPPIVLTGHCQGSEVYPVSTLEIGSAVGVCQSIL